MRLSLAALMLTTGLTFGGCTATQLTASEAELVETMSAASFQPATRETRDNIETQPLLAQATFWQREYELNPGDLESAIKLAATVRRMGNPQRAVEITQTTRALYPKDPYLVAEYAAALVASDRGDKALPVIETALRTSPGYARLWSLRGASLDQAERYAEARESYQRALSITPHDPNVLANMGLSFALEGDAATAETWLVKASSIPGASESVTRNLDLVRQLQGKSPAPAAPRAASAPRAVPGLAGPASMPSASRSAAPTPSGSSQPAGNFQVFSNGEARSAADAARMMARRSTTRTMSVPAQAAPQPASTAARPSTKPAQTLPVQAAGPNALDRIARNASPARRAVVQGRQQQQMQAQQAQAQMQSRMQAQQQRGYAPQGQPAQTQSPFAPRPAQPGYAQPGYGQPYPQGRAQAPAQAYPQGYAQPVPTPSIPRPQGSQQGYPAGYPQGAAPYAPRPAAPQQVQPGLPRGRARRR